MYKFAWQYLIDHREFRNHPSYRTFTEITGRTLRALVIEPIVVNGERARQSAQWAYNQELGERARAAARIEQRRLAEITRKKNEVDQLKASRLKKLTKRLGFLIGLRKYGL